MSTLDADELEYWRERLLDQVDFDPASRRQRALVDAAMQLVGEALSAPVAKVSVEGARAVVERVECYGLRIGIDANGRAAEVEPADMCEMLEVWR